MLSERCDGDFRQGERSLAFGICEVITEYGFVVVLFSVSDVVCVCVCTEYIESGSVSLFG